MQTAKWPRRAGGFATATKSRGKSWICLCQTADPVALNGMNHRANAQVTAAVLITNGRCLILFLKSHSFAPTETHTQALGWIILCSEFELIRRLVVNVYAQAVKRTQLTILYWACSEPISSSRWKLMLLRWAFVERYSITHCSDIKFESIAGYLLKSWPRPPLVTLIHGFNKWGAGGRCARRCEHKAHGASITLIRYSIFNRFPPPLLSHDLCTCCWLHRPAWPVAGLHADTCTWRQHVHTKTWIHPAAVSVSNCASVRLNAKWG